MPDKTDTHDKSADKHAVDVAVTDHKVTNPRVGANVVGANVVGADHTVADPRLGVDAVGVDHVGAHPLMDPHVGANVVGTNVVGHNPRVGEKVVDVNHDPRAINVDPKEPVKESKKDPAKEQKEPAKDKDAPKGTRQEPGYKDPSLDANDAMSVAHAKLGATKGPGVVKTAMGQQVDHSPDNEHPAEVDPKHRDDYPDVVDTKKMVDPHQIVDPHKDDYGHDSPRQILDHDHKGSLDNRDLAEVDHAIVDQPKLVNPSLHPADGHHVVDAHELGEIDHAIVDQHHLVDPSQSPADGHHVIDAHELGEIDHAIVDGRHVLDTHHDEHTDEEIEAAAAFDAKDGMKKTVGEEDHYGTYGKAHERHELDSITRTVGEDHSYTKKRADDPSPGDPKKDLINEPVRPVSLVAEPLKGPVSLDGPVVPHGTFDPENHELPLLGPLDDHGIPITPGIGVVTPVEVSAGEDAKKMEKKSKKRAEAVDDANADEDDDEDFDEDEDEKDEAQEEADAHDLEHGLNRNTLPETVTRTVAGATNVHTEKKAEKKSEKKGKKAKNKKKKD